MPIIDNELVGEGVVNTDGLFHPARYVPAVTGENIVQKIRENVTLHGDITWMTDLTTGESMTYSKLADAIDRVYNSLRRRGLKPKDVVGLIGANHIEMPIVYFAVWKACGSCSAMDVGLLVEQIRSRMIETKCPFIMTDEPRADKVLQAVQGLNIQVFVFGQAEGCIPIAQLFEPQQEKFEHDEFEFDVLAPAWFTYSSGTTGIPKGIVHTHYSLSPYLRPPDDKNKKMELAGQTFMFTGSMMHGSGLFYSMRATAEHATAFTFTVPTLEGLLQGIDTIKPTRINIFPHEMAGICLHKETNRYDLSSVDTIVYCGSTALSTFERQIFEIMPNLQKLISMYGMSETMLLTLDRAPISAVKLDREEIIKSHKIGSSGQIFPFAKIRIIDSNTGEKLGPGGVGEVVANTPFLMRGYLNQPTEVIDGWFNTGDQGYYDTDGDLFVIGRYKEMIKYQARKVAPSNIETQLMTHPAVKDVAVVGLPHDIDGEHPLAYVVIKTNQEGRPLANPQELIDFTNEKVVDDERLRGGVRFIESIPRNKLGKILRHHLVAKLQSELNGAI
ncbi:4-coumarate--CoA ligase-like 7 [Daphnia pulicaria]|uniref:4-coumarate--CoA ligase-like 7 n=1 Tax=Daphnia pulicaria TaxID=35523 RepID=UPI001EEB2F27|nr:4-coumarate--CoA ligase-like 7 [Daphnia pulicaria]